MGLGRRGRGPRVLREEARQHVRQEAQRRNERANEDGMCRLDAFDQPCITAQVVKTRTVTLLNSLIYCYSRAR